MKVNYTVEFYKIKDDGIRRESDGTEFVHGWEECFNTENLEKAIKEFEDRKEYINNCKESYIGTTLSIWVDDVEVDQTNYEHDFEYDDF